MQSAAAIVATAATMLVLSTVSANADGDAAAGENVFNRCKICHTIEEGGAPKQGPNLHGVYGREAGATEHGTLHSGALEMSGVVWNEETLTEWLKAPTKFISGVRMVYRLNKEQDIADVIAYLKANSPDAE
jgi:cytochrome c